MLTKLPELSISEISRSFSLAAKTYDANAILQREVADRLLERLEYVKISPEIIVDLGAGTGYCAQFCKQFYPNAEVIGVDLAPAMVEYAKQLHPDLTWYCADAQALPLQDNSVDLVISNLMFQWITDLPAVLKEIRRILKPNGLLMFTTNGPDTLKELRLAWQQVDAHTRVHDFTDMHDIGDALLQAEFSDPVMDAQRITMHYRTVQQLLQDLKSIGARNVHANRTRGLLGKQKYQDFLNAYEHFQTDSGKFPATYEIIFGQAWMPNEVAGFKADAAGQVNIPLQALRRSK